MKFGSYLYPTLVKTTSFQPYKLGFGYKIAFICVNTEYDIGVSTPWMNSLTDQENVIIL